MIYLNQFNAFLIPLTQNQSDMISLKKLVASVCLLVVSSVIGYFLYHEYKTKNIYYIAVPTSFDEIDTSGRDTVQSIQFYLDKLQEKNKSENYLIKIKVFDDVKKTPEENAKEIVKLPNLLGVIGHYSSGNTFEAMKVYEKTNIPVIGPAPSHTDLSIIYPQFYHVVFRNKEQGEFIPFYIKHVFKKKKMIILRTTGAYIDDLYKYTIQSARNLGLEVVQDISFGVEKPTDEMIEEKVKTLELDSDVILVPLLSNDAIVLKALKEIRKLSTTQLIFGCESVASNSISQAFQADENIFAVTPHSPQLVNDKCYDFIKAYKKKYGEAPGWYGTHSYDAAFVIGQSLPKLDSKKPIEEIRDDLRRNMKKVFNGITGRLDYTKRNYPTRKDINIAYIRAKQWQPAQLQLVPIYDPNTITNLEREIADQHVIFDSGDYYRIANIVYTGTAIKAITELDLAGNSAIVEFFLWFRHLPSDKSADMIYLSSLNDPVLKAYHSKTTKDGAEVQVLTDPKNKSHVLYKIKQKFALDTISLGDQEYLKYARTIGLSLRPNLDPQQSMRLVADTAILDQKPRIDNTSWHVNNMESYADTMTETTFGNPKFEKDTSIPFSRFNTKIVLDTNHIFNPWNLEYKTAFWLLLLSIFIFIGTFVVTYFEGIVRLFSFLGISLASQTLFFNYAQTNADLLRLKPAVVMGFDILSWIVVGYAMMLWVKVHYFRRIEKQTNLPVPHLLKMLIYTLIVTTIGSCIIAFVFRYPVTGLVTSGGFFVAVIGFAIQQNLSHIFSGLMLNIEKPFRVGDWIQLGPETGRIIGKVLDVTWRSTRVLTKQNNIISVPNSKIGESMIENYNYPNDRYSHTFEVLLDRNHNPDDVMRVMKEAVKPDSLVLHFALQPLRIDGENMVYIVYVDVSDYDTSRFIVWGEVLSKAWKALKEAGLYTVQLRHFVDEPTNGRVVKENKND